MIYPRFQVWFVLAALVSPDVLAFSPSKPPANESPLASSISQEFNRDDVDITNVLSEVEAALQLATESFTSTEAAESKMVKFNDDLNLQEKMGRLQKLWENADEKSQTVATAIAGTTVGLVAGSPLVLGAALGLAGSKLLDESEEGLKNRKILEKAGIEVTDKLRAAIEFAHSEIEKEEDPTKIAEKVALAFQDHAADIKNKAKETPALVARVVKDKLENEEFKEEMKMAPGRAFQALKGFVQSEEVKAASGSVVKALKETMESDEVKALQSRASQAIKESLKK